jgi:hypothetical protein
MTKESDMSDLPLLNRDALLNALVIKPVRVEVPELGGALYMKELSVEQRLALTELSDSAGKEEQFRILVGLLPLVVSDEDGNALLTSDDVAQLIQSRNDAIQSLIHHAMALNGMTTKSVEDIQGNSEPGPSCDESTNSPES